MKRVLLVSLIHFVLISSCVSADKSEKVICGADRIAYYLPLLKDSRIGVVANHTSQIGGTHLVDTLLSRDVNINRIFSPEHGFRGDADAGAHINSGVDEVTGLALVSLYGSRRKPLESDLEGLDIILFDIQDVGTRFYTYISTLQYVMEVAAIMDIEVIILDRPNPNANYIDGPVLEEEYKSFVGMQPIPVVHGMTIGEYAKMINSEGCLEDGIKCNLEVIECLNYTHTTQYVLPIAPSPNLPNQNSIYLYPSICFFEGTVFSCGRGTESPFQLFGHPDFPSNLFSFIPSPGRGASKPKLEGIECFGIDLTDALKNGIVPHDALNLDWLIDAYNSFPEKDKFFIPYFNTLAGTDKLKQQIIKGMSSEEIRESWQDDLNNFRKIRAKYLLYD